MASATRVQLSKSLPDLVREIVSRTCGRMEISEQYMLAFDLGLDDADRAELLMAVELALCVDFSVSEVARISTVGDLIDVAENKTRPTQQAIGDDDVCFGSLTYWPVQVLTTGKATEVGPIRLVS